MNKRSLGVVSAVLLSLGMSSAFAAMDLPLGSGTIDGTVNKVAKVSLRMLQSQPVVYDVNCSVTDPQGKRLPVKVKVDLENTDAFGVPTPYTAPYSVTFDGQVGKTHQHLIKDNNPHSFGLPELDGQLLNQTNVVLTWLASDDVATPISFSCSATPFVGK